MYVILLSDVFAVCLPLSLFPPPPQYTPTNSPFLFHDSVDNSFIEELTLQRGGNTLLVCFRTTDKIQRDNSRRKLQALVYDILPSTTAVFSYAIGSRKLSANEFFVGAQKVVSLLQLMSDVCFITDHVAYASSNKT